MAVVPANPLHRLLVALCRRDAESNISDADYRQITQPAMSSELLMTAQLHRVHGLILTVLERVARRPSLATTSLPAAWRAPLQLLRRQAVGWDMEQGRVLARLDKRGVAAVVLKGGALRSTVYAESSQRPVADLDLLFTPDAIAAARASLEELGYHDPSSALQNDIYARYHFHFRMQHAAGFTVELHWALSPPGPHAQIDAAKVMHGAHAVAGTGRPFLAPRAEHMVLHLSSQCIEDAFGLLGRIVDIDRVIANANDAFEWEEIRVAAVRGHLQGVVGVALRLAELLFDTPVPAGFLDTLEIPPLTRANLAALRPVSWILERRGQRFIAAGLTMEAWLLGAPGGRRDMALKLLRIRPDPMRSLRLNPDSDDDTIHSAQELRRWIPPVLKVAGYQAFVWCSAIGGLFTARARDELRFWTRKNGPHGTS
jgi:hypothetical protein